MKPLARDEAPSSLLASIDDGRLLASAPEIDPGHLERALYGSAREFLARPGKAFRARLIEACYALAGGLSGSVPAAAVEAIELLHGGSLIVDDIQDDAQVRRGAPALHRMIGTPLALNTGNWLYFVALARLDELPLDASKARELARAAHLCLIRCHEGQALDLSLRVGELRRSELAAVARTTSALKTGALAGFAAQLGGTCAGASSRVLATLHAFGSKIGLALQMLDDLGSFVAAPRHHKALEDLRGERISWIWSWAGETLDELTFKQLVKQLARESEHEQLRARLAETVEPLGRLRVREALDEAERELTTMFAPSYALEAMRAELSRLEKSYG
jgi:geranylgeranyl pyrophosphate synthase